VPASVLSSDVQSGSHDIATVDVWKDLYFQDMPPRLGLPDTPDVADGAASST
jgi:hypothetical protein